MDRRQLTIARHPCAKGLEICSTTATAIASVAPPSSKSFTAVICFGLPEVTSHNCLPEVIHEFWKSSGIRPLQKKTVFESFAHTLA